MSTLEYIPPKIYLAESYALFLLRQGLSVWEIWKILNPNPPRPDRIIQDVVFNEKELKTALNNGWILKSELKTGSFLIEKSINAETIASEVIKQTTPSITALTEKIINETLRK